MIYCVRLHPTFGENDIVTVCLMYMNQGNQRITGKLSNGGLKKLTVLSGLNCCSLFCWNNPDYHAVTASVTEIAEQDSND